MLYQKIFSKEYLMNFLLLAIPISYILGNLVLNINIIILIVTSLVFYNHKIFSYKFSPIDKVIILFFSYILLNGIINNFFNFPANSNNNFILVKSILFMRFLLLYFSLKYLIRNEIIDLKKIFIFYSIIVLFVCVDIIIQYIFGYDLFGFEATARRFSGPFGDELVSGAFIQRFFIFPLFALILFSKIKKGQFLDFSFFLIIILSAVGIFLSGNRVPLLLFIIMITIFFFFQPKIRKAVMYVVVLFSLTFVIVLNSNINFKKHYSSLIIESGKITNYIKLKVTGKSLLGLKSIYIKEIESGILTWQENKVFGGGIKSFYVHCVNINPNDWTLFGGVNCNQHPHNYYLEAAAALGIVGLIIFLLLIGSIIFSSYKESVSNRDDSAYKKLIFPFLILFIIEIFPFKTTGSLFTTGNATYLFIIIAFVVGLNEYRLKKD